MSSAYFVSPVHFAVASTLRKGLPMTRSPVGPLKIDVSKGKHIHHLHLDLSVGVVF